MIKLKNSKIAVVLSPLKRLKAVTPLCDLTNSSVRFWIAPMFLLLAGALAGCGASSKSAAAAAPDIPRAAVVPVTRRNISTTLEIASEFQPFQEIDVYAKVSGYIKKLYFDWGTHVQAGQLMAVLEIPELQQQIQHDEAALAEAGGELHRAQSAYSVAHVTYQRLASVQKVRPELISQEDIDVAQGKDLEADAAVSAAQQALLAARAALDKDKTLFGYANMTAPFDGVVTQVYAYTGALLPAGTSSNIGNSALCHLSQNDLLRLVIPVPERAVPDIRIGDTVAIKVSGLNKKFQGKIVRFSDEIDPQTRTMHTEVDVPNSRYELVPGMYATVDIPLQTAQNVLTVPIQSVQFSGQGQGTVLIVNGSNHIEKRNVTLGLQDAALVEVVSGLRADERVVFGEQQQFKNGELVTPTVVKPPQTE
ncbi:MAG TPA: efflux RND transporter periplasmic adaptor subunit [Candidatus Acidoferrales bacterium]|nr:efflux RND transporter periplasmic adaptor subunit [Candidatus Acidoferrales bacterium]